MAILTNDLYDSVRAALDTKLTEEDLPNSIVAMDIYAGAAELDVLARDPQAESRTDDDLKRVKNAAVYFCAARLAPAIPHLVETGDENNTWRWQQRDWQARAQELRQLADESVNEVLTTDVVRPKVFSVASGRRGR